MSYRTLKRLLGETNFEVKCLVLFGVGLSMLAAVTVGLYWWQTRDLNRDQSDSTSQQLIAMMIQQRHADWLRRITQQHEGVEEAEAEPLPPGADNDDGGEDKPEPALAPAEVAPLAALEPIKQVGSIYQHLIPEDLQGFQFEVFPINSRAEAGERPADQTDSLALVAIEDGEPAYVHRDRAEDRYRFYGAIYARKECLGCHRHERLFVEGKAVDTKVGDLIGVGRITRSLATVESTMHGANAFVITSEFIKVVLAILAIYLVVRYVITKPVLHLKRVSDAIAHGNLDMRADIRTGDEFEELSHAFNRMLRHLVTVQDELREVNQDLDGKVDELAQVNLQLYEMNNVKNEFLATMSHELRTPLNSILGFSEVLSAAANLDEKQHRYVSNIQASGKSLMALINDVLDLAKIESGTMELHPAEFDVSELVERQVSIMMPMAERRQIALTWAVEPDIPTLFQDAGKLQQVLNNLLSNAIKFTPEGGRVRVHAEMRGVDQFSLVIEDNGIGIPLDEQERIFEKFRQGRGTSGQKDTLTRKYEGTGLGLSIVRELTRLLRGQVELESEFGKGSQFTVTMPLVLDELDAVDEEATSRLVGLNRFRTIDIPKPVSMESDLADSSTDDPLPADSKKKDDQPDGSGDASSHDASVDTPSKDDGDVDRPESAVSAVVDADSEKT